MVGNVRRLTVVTVNVNKMKNRLKALALCHFLRDVRCHVAMLQEATRDLLLFLSDFSHFTVIDNVNPEEETGTAILVCPELTVGDVDILPSGRAIACLISGVYFINVYGPSGSNKPAKAAFYGQDVCYLLRRNPEFVVLGGDFNAVLEARDQSPRPGLCQELSRLVESFRLRDAWRVLYPGHTVYTYFYPTGCSRLDRVYVSANLAAHVRRAEVKPVAFSDHCAFLTDVVLPQERFVRRHSRWKLNCGILTDDVFIDRFRALWSRLVLRRPDSISILEWWVQEAKPAVRQFLIDFSREAARWRRATFSFYQNCLLDLAQRVPTQPDLLPTFKRLKAQLLADMRDTCQGAVARSQPVGPVGGEPLSLYHLNRERRRRERLAIDVWRRTDGAQTTDMADVEADVHRHFSALFSSVDIDREALSGFLQATPHVLTRTDRVHLNEEYTAEDVTDALRCSPRGKSPGPDGIPAEFYLAFFNEFRDTFVRIINEIRDGVRVPAAFVEGYIVLIPKSTALPSINNVRPITLMNADYKVMTRCITHRLKSVLPRVLSPDQTCAVQGRNIFDALLAYRDCIAMVQSERIRTAAIVLIDFKNAFDRVSHEYLRRIMVRMGFGQKFTLMVRNLFAHATSRVSVNGSLTPSISVQRSVRQGCPLSMSLFSIALDPLLRLITQECHGLQLGPVRLTCKAYADDLGVFVNSSEDVDNLRAVLQRFERATGAIINTQKTVLLPLTPRARTLQRDWFCLREQQKVLGVLFTSKLQRMEALNWRPTLHAIRAVCRISAARNLAILQKTALVNSTILAKAWHLAQVLPVPKELGRAIMQAVFWFLWQGETFKVSLQACTLSPREGGLGLVDFGAKCAALLLKRTTAVLERDPVSPTAVVFNKYRPASVVAPVSVGHIPFTLNHVRRYYLLNSYVLLSDMPGNSVSDVTAALRGRPVRIKWEYRYPQHDWTAVWANLANTVLPPAVHDTWYKVVQRTYPTNSKLYSIRKLASGSCESCLVEDTLDHRFVCTKYCSVWRTACDMLRLIHRTDIRSVTPTDALIPQCSAFPSTKRNATVWILGHSVYAIFTLRMTSVTDFLLYLWTTHDVDKRRPNYDKLFARFLHVALTHAFTKNSLTC